MEATWSWSRVWVPLTPPRDHKPVCPAASASEPSKGLGLMARWPDLSAQASPYLLSSKGTGEQSVRRGCEVCVWWGCGGGGEGLTRPVRSWATAQAGHLSPGRNPDFSGGQGVSRPRPWVPTPSRLWGRGPVDLPRHSQRSDTLTLVPTELCANIKPISKRKRKQSWASPPGARSPPSAAAGTVRVGPGEEE